MHKTRVAVLRGGPSAEFDVSLKTGAGMLKALDKNRYEPLDVVITRAGEWLLRGSVRSPHTILEHVDVVLVGLHGAYGEDGTVQRLMDGHGIKYSGSRAFPSAIALNKAITKSRLSALGINMARHMVFGREVGENISGIAESVRAFFGPKYIVKPIGSGSSVGVLFAENVLELEQALRQSLRENEQVIVEEYIEGREATCGVVDHFRDKRHYALPPIEIVRTSPVWGYEAKYDGKTEEVCPGNFSRADKEEIERLAILVHKTLELSHYSRSDFIVSDKGVYFLEVNTLPGMTPESLLPKALSAVGCSYETFVDHLINLAQHHT
jgi:D-alanine-D-alanine ligase